MASIVLRVRFTSGEHTDVVYEEPEHVDQTETADHAIEALTKETGILRCRHGERLVALYARGVASVEVAPRGAIL